MTRRTFIKSGACAFVALGALPPFLVRTTHASTGRKKILVAVFQRGAVDGLSMVVPHGDPDYSPGRKTIALDRPARGQSERAFDLDGFFALHPALAPLLPLWNERALAIVHACGSPDSTRSHFDAQDYMETGTPGVKSTRDGWLARSLDTMAARPSPFRAVAIGPALPRILRGDVAALAMASLPRFELQDGRLATRRGFEALYTAGPRDLLHGSGREAFDALKMLRAADAARITPANGAEYPRGPFGDAMGQIAQLIKADVGLEVAFAQTGGWDTHVAQGNERGQLATRLADLGAALAAFARDLGERMADVIVVTMSEFGRTVAENGNGGTDHGHGTAMLVLGGTVRGGVVYGRWPGLGREHLFEGRDLAVTTDFRALFSEVVTEHLGVSATAAIFPGWSPGASQPLGLLTRLGGG